ncbi:MAG: 3-dehydroquinate synthase [Acidobacteriota bacterium]|nr:3-dehydroquinate synthase [Acidobacteriota bacterium]
MHPLPQTNMTDLTSHITQQRGASRARLISVELGERSYDIRIGAHLLPNAGSLIRSALGRSSHSLAIISNPSVLALYGQTLTSSLTAAGFHTVTALMGDGERYKTLNTVARLHRALAQQHLDRHSAIVALGGGVVGDVAGFVAATFMRGIALIHIPTTLLAAIDSSIGGKTGVNLPEGKNLVGAFHQPKLVITDVALLDSLPPRQFRAGLYEALKYGLLADPALFEQISQGIHTRAQLIDVIARCCRIKADIVASDEREAGRRQLLNLGHTFGHALEAITGYRRFLHGEAVGYGLILAARLARQLALLPQSDVDRIETAVYAIGRLPTVADLDAHAWLAAMRHDKKARHRRLTFIAPVRIGEATIVHDVPERLIQQVLHQFIHSAKQK